MSATREAEIPRGTLGTFGGVFTPSILTILGLILFVKMGYVVGSAGLGRALLIILAANTISVLTSISLSAVATNLRVKKGGDYYLISRTLGVHYGGALGLVLFLAQSVSIGFYAVGFGEVLTSIFGMSSGWWPQSIAAMAVGALFVLAWMGADWATRFQYLIMAVLFAGIASFYAGALPAWDMAQLRVNFTPSGDQSFWILFAIFFPAVTGFTQGVSMSGDLKDPGRSLPRGTLFAVGLSILVYFSVAALFAASRPGDELAAADATAMRGVALLPWLVDAGAIAATLSSALASFLGAPRILQSLAGDKVFPFLNSFAAGSGPSDNPRRGILLAGAIALLTVGLGNINAIAPVVSMFFLISYGLLNYATYTEARASSPSFRPRFRFFNARLSLIGGIGCLAAMLAINPTAGAIAVVVIFAVHQYLSRRVVFERWADADRSRRFQRVREDLYAISADLEHPRHWRPVLLAFSDNPERRERILRFASWLEGRSGLTTAVRVIKGKGPEARRLREEAFRELKQEIDRCELPAFPRVIVAPTPENVLPVLLQSHGLGPLRSNTVMFNWYDRSSDYGAPGLRHYGSYLRQALRFGFNLVLLGAGPDDFNVIEKTKSTERRIDVWYRENATGNLSLMLAYLMTRTEGWKDARIRLLVPAHDGKDRAKVLQDFERILEEARIVAEPVIIDDPGHEAIVRESASAAVVLLPFRLEDEGPASVYQGALDDLIRKLGVTALILASQDISLDAEPESGPQAEIAEAVDALAKAEKTARQAENKAVEAEENARRAGEAQEPAGVVQEAEEKAERCRRRAARDRAKAEECAKLVEELTGGNSSEPAPGE
jgi:amino acid transporter